jgi:hypothetical protein
VEQTIEILDEKYTGEDIVKGLQSGEMCTSIQEGGEVIHMTEEKTKVIGKVINVDNNCEYVDFDKPFEAKVGAK